MKIKTLEKGLIDFKNQYPNITSADIQAFSIGWNAAIKSVYPNEPDQPKTDSTNKVMKEVCGDEINPYLLNGSELKKAEDFKKRY